MQKSEERNWLWYKLSYIVCQTLRDQKDGVEWSVMFKYLQIITGTAIIQMEQALLIQPR